MHFWFLVESEDESEVVMVGRGVSVCVSVCDCTRASAMYKCPNSGMWRKLVIHQLQFTLDEFHTAMFLFSILVSFLLFTNCIYYILHRGDRFILCQQHLHQSKYENLWTSSSQHLWLAWTTNSVYCINTLHMWVSVRSITYIALNTKFSVYCINTLLLWVSVRSLNCSHHFCLSSQGNRERECIFPAVPTTADVPWTGYVQFSWY